MLLVIRVPVDYSWIWTIWKIIKTIFYIKMKFIKRQIIFVLLTIFCAIYFYIFCSTFEREIVNFLFKINDKKRLFYVDSAYFLQFLLQISNAKYVSHMLDWQYEHFLSKPCARQYILITYLPTKMSIFIPLTSNKEDIRMFFVNIY